MAAAGLGGYVLCGINTTRRGDGLLSDVRRADCQFLLTDEAHLPLLEGLDLAGVTVIDVSAADSGRAAGEGCHECRSARAVPRGRRDGHADDDLHLGHQRRAEGRAGGAPDGAVLGAEPGRAARGHPRRRRLLCDAALPLRCRHGGVRPGRGVGGGAGVAAEVLRVWAAAGHQALRLYVPPLRRQSALLRPGHPATARRRGEPPEARLRQRGERHGDQAVRGTVRLPRDRRVRLDGDGHLARPGPLGTRPAVSAGCRRASRSAAR